MGLKAALKAHAAGDLECAKEHYGLALANGETPPVLFQNYGALLRQQGQQDEALSLYDQGLQRYPGDPSILANRTNLLIERQPMAALADLLQVLRAKPDLLESWATVVTLLRDHGAPVWSLQLLKEALAVLGPQHKLLINLLGFLNDWPLPSSPPPDALGALLIQRIEAGLKGRPLQSQAETRMNLAYERQRRGETLQARQVFDQILADLTTAPITALSEAESRQKLIDVGSWNYGCMLLKGQDFERGWRLYDHGLRVPHHGPQRWQRALIKPFPASQLPLWRGEPLAGKRLLLLEEQGIGDTMMFATLLRPLIAEAARLGLLIADRLYPLYARAYGQQIDLWRHSDLAAGRLRADVYDYQSALGSVPQHRFTNPSAYAPQVPALKPRTERAVSLRERYLSESAPANVSRLVGISWSGGAVPNRVRQKSAPMSDFASLLQPVPGVRFVSLQYGQVAEMVRQWQRVGLDVIHDPEVNPLKDMDLWLDQVAACDAVLTVANTTVHGSGGLNIPTLCLLSRHSDWRWLDDPRVKRSYWYPSVGIVRETALDGWQPALRQARLWLEQGSPMPEGLSYLD